MGKFILFSAILLIGLLQVAFGQCPTANFLLNATACINQNVSILNSSASAVTYEWDFCSEDLSNTPSPSVMFDLPATNSSYKGDFVESNGLFYSFFASRSNGKLYRLEFGNNVMLAPNFVDLGQLGIPLSGGLLTVQIINEGGIYYGFVIDFYNKLYRFQIGASITNAPSDAELIYQDNSLTPIDLEIVQDGAQRFAFIAYYNSNTLTRIRFQNSFAEPSPNFIIDSFAVIGFANLSGISFLKECSSWYAVATSMDGGQLTKIFFDAGLTDTSPTYVSISGLGFPLTAASGVSLVVEGGQYYAFVQAHKANSNLYRINFGNSLSNAAPVGDDLSDFGILSDVFGFSMHRANSDWLVLAHQNTGQKIFKIVFPQNCFSDTQTSTVANPTIHFNASGSQVIALRAIDSQGNEAFKSASILVSSQISPTIDFTNQNSCANNDVSFSASSSGVGISSYQWNFGDTQTSTQQNPINVFSSAGTYSPLLKVVGTNTCENFIQKTLTIYNSPIADFMLPPATPICTNQTYQLTNTSTSDPGSNPTWEWRLNGALISSVQDFATQFKSTSAQEIRLKASIPGCSNEVIKNIATVIAGPLVNFSVNDDCVDNMVNFSNNTTGIVDVGYFWNFGDASNTTIPNPSHTYSSPSNYQVSLTAGNAAGCNNTFAKQLKIYSKPAPDFSVGLPPFSCSNSATPFQNSTPVLTDSNIATWAWQFGDQNNGTSSQQAPSFTYSAAGNYNVGLTATSNQGCTGSITKSITIAAGPVADFAVGVACLNQVTKFTDLSTGEQTRSWQIGSSGFSVPNPSYTFATNGTFPVTLTVSSSNSCVTTKVKSVTIFLPPAQDFSTNNLCAGKNAVFTDATPSAQDSTIAWNWNFDGNSFTGNPVSYNFTTSGTYNAKMTTTHTSGCKYTLSKSILINSSPVAAFTPTPDRGAAPLIVQFANTSQGATTYGWKFYDKTTTTSAQTSPVYTFLSLGDYSVELTAKNAVGCSDILTVPIKVLVPSIDLILNNFSLTPDPATGKLKGVVTILNSSNIPIPTAEVALVLADKGVVNETLTVNLGPGQSIVKTLSFTVSPNQFDFNFLCAEIISGKDIQQDNNRRCIDLEKSDYFFSPYPNPTSGSLEVDWISVTADYARINIYDSMGKNSYSFETLAKAGLNQVILDISFLTSGLYYLSVETSGSKKTSRFFRE